LQNENCKFTTLLLLCFTTCKKLPIVPRFYFWSYNIVESSTTTTLGLLQSNLSCLSKTESQASFFELPVLRFTTFGTLASSEKKYSHLLLKKMWKQYLPKTAQILLKTEKIAFSCYFRNCQLLAFVLALYLISKKHSISNPGFQLQIVKRPGYVHTSDPN